MSVSGPRTIGVFLNIMTGVDFLYLVWQIAGDGFHHITQRHNPFDGTKFIGYKREVRAGITELLKRRKQRQGLREHQRLANQDAQVERFAAQRLLQ